MPSDFSDLPTLSVRAEEHNEKPPRKVGMITHELTGVEVPLRLDVKTCGFYANYAGRVFEGPEGEEVRQAVIRAIAEAQVVDFAPLIRVVVEPGGRSRSERGEGAGFAVTADRFYFARGETTLYRLGWQAHRVGQSEALRAFRPIRWPRHGKPQDFVLPYVVICGSVYPYDNYYLPYSDSVWAGVNHVIDALRDLRQRLDLLLSGEGFLKRLEELGQHAGVPLLSHITDTASQAPGTETGREVPDGLVHDK